MTSKNSSVIVQIYYSFNMDVDAFQRASEPFAAAISEVPGLVWKIWLINREERQAGGTYYFEDIESARAYLEGPILSPFVKNPAIIDFSAKIFDIQHGPTTITRGPVHELMDADSSPKMV